MRTRTVILIIALSLGLSGCYGFARSFNRAYNRSYYGTPPAPDYRCMDYGVPGLPDIRCTPS